MPYLTSKRYDRQTNRQIDCHRNVYVLFTSFLKFLSRGVLIIVFTGLLRPEVQPLTLLYTIFVRKGTPVVYLLLTKWFPFHIR